MESLQKAGVIGTGIIGKISYETEIADPEEFQSHFLDDLKHQAGFLVNGKIPSNLNNVPKNAKPAPLEIIVKERVKI